MLKKEAVLQDKYRILHALGKRGISGCTYLAKTIKDNLQYAIKELDPRPEDYENLGKRFSMEAEYLRKLRGFNGQIPSCYDFFKDLDSDGVERDYIVQEYIEGQTLAQSAKALGRAMSESEVKKILASLLPVIEHIHQEGFIHRDIKPDNIILRANNNVPVLIDFGAVKEYELTIVRGDSDLTDLIGTEGYYDEDQKKGNPTIASDLYALGAVAVYLLTNLSPRTIRQPDGKMLWGDHVIGISQDFFYLINKAIEPRTAYSGQRFESARAMLNALEQVASDEEIGEELTKLATRKILPIPVEGFVRCRKCRYYLRKEESCTNCGEYNVQSLRHDEIYLLDNSSNHYVTETYLSAINEPKALLRLNSSDYYLINNSVDDYIRKYTEFTKGLPEYMVFDRSNILRTKLRNRPMKVILGENLEAIEEPLKNFLVAVWICGGIVSGFALPFLLMGDISPKALKFGAVAGVVLLCIGLLTYKSVKEVVGDVIKALLKEKHRHFRRLKDLRTKINDNRVNLRKGLFDEAEKWKQELEQKKQSVSVYYKECGFYLKRFESLINNQLEAMSKSRKNFQELSEMMDKSIKEIPGDISTEVQESQKRNKKRTAAALQFLAQQDLKYQVKIKEITLLRLNNTLQGETPRQKVSRKARKQVKEQIIQMAKLAYEMHSNLKDTDIATAGSEQSWFKRISIVREILAKLDNSLGSHMIDLGHKNPDEETADLPLDVTSGLDRLAGYLTNADFEREYDILRVKYGTMK